MTHPISAELLRAYPSNEARYRWELTPKPFWIDSPHGPLFAWYHPPRGEPRNRAVLLCDAVGSDRMNLHLAYRHAALWYAYNGFPALRIDYAGTADSSGMPGEGNQLPVWLEGLEIGADALKAHSGADALAVFGIRFGATLAMAFAAQRSDIREAILWGPYAGGGRFLRDARALERLSGRNAEARKPSCWEDGDLESIGFLFRQETVSALEQLDISPSPGIDAVCLFTWDRPQAESGLVEAWRDAGVDVDFHDVPLMEAGESTIRQAVPAPFIMTSEAWMRDRSQPTHSGPVQEASLPTTADIPLTDGSFVTEEIARAGPEEEIFALCTLPRLRDTAAADTAVVLVSGGNNHRCGINRNYTEWARRWARRGIPVLRLDVRGLGDSPPLRSGELNELYRRNTAGDVVHAMDWLQSRHGIRNFVLCGLCAGAFQALHAARSDGRVHGLILLELLRFYQQEMTLWSRGVRLARRMARRVAAGLGLSPDGLFSPLGRWIQQLCERGASVLVVYRPDEAMFHEFNAELARRRSAIEATGRFSLVLMPNTNHIFSPLWSQERLAAVLDQFILDRQFGPVPDVTCHEQ